MGIGLDLRCSTIIDRDTGESFDFGEITSLEIEQEERGNKEEPLKPIKGFTNSATFTCESATIVNQEVLDKLLTPTTSSAFTMEWDTKILVQARWHKKARIRKKWLKRYGYIKDTVKTIVKANRGEYNAESGESSFDVDNIQYIWRPDQLRRGLRIIGVN